MNTLFIYMVKVAFYLIAFYLVYSIMLSRDTSYKRNRIFILFSLSLSFIFPLITLQTIKPLNIQFFGKLLSEVFITANSDGTKTVTSGILNISLLQTIYSIYITGIIVFSVKLIIDLVSLILLIVRNKDNGSRIINFQGLNTSGFSAMGYIFINSRLSQEDATEIIRHEQNHLRQSHFIDIIFIEVATAFQWFNPVIYLFNRSLRAIHEYQADQECISSGVPVANYQCLLLNQVFKSRAFNLTNSFSNPSLVKKRMVMMTKRRTSNLASIKMLLVVPVTGFVFLAISAYREMPASSGKSMLPAEISKNLLSENMSETLAPPPPPPPPPPSRSSESNKTVRISNEKPSYEPEEAPYVVVEEMPMFPGGDAALLKYIAENTNYPEKAKENNLHGRVIIRFCINSKGNVGMISVIKGVSPELDTEALRVVSTLPTFKPGKQGGKPVPVWYMVPITFALK
jgi:TonB family protein